MKPLFRILATSISTMALCMRTASTSRPFVASRTAVRPRVAVAAVATKYKVDVEHEGKTYSLEVPQGESILSVALDKGESHSLHIFLRG